MKIKVNPLFFALALALVAFGHLLDFVWMTLCVLLHEIAHALMARLRGYIPKNVVLLPYGAMMSVDESIDKKSSVLIGLAGPLANLALALATLGTWWLFPGVYPYTISFLHANLTLGVFNLLPVYPLDGSRVALGLCKNRIKTIKALRVAGVCVSVALFALFIAAFFFGLNFSFGIIAVFVFYGATFGSKDETYASVLDVANKKRTQKNASFFVCSFWLRLLVASSSVGRNDVALRFTTLTLHFAQTTLCVLCYARDESLRLRQRRKLA